MVWERDISEFFTNGWKGKLFELPKTTPPHTQKTPNPTLPPAKVMHENCCPKLLLKDECTIHFRHSAHFQFSTMLDSDWARGILEVLASPCFFLENMAKSDVGMEGEELLLPSLMPKKTSQGDEGLMRDDKWTCSLSLNKKLVCLEKGWRLFRNTCGQFLLRASAPSQRYCC